MLASSITDQPITKVDEESLDIQDYANALVEFIENSATPLTIGIQGEWGSGKTSLMHLIRNGVIDKKLATAWVNTWEYSLFREVHETTPAIMRALLEDLKKSCGENWSGELGEKLEAVSRFMKSIGKIAVNMAGKKLTGQDDVAGQVQLYEETESIATLAEIRNKISDIISKLITSKSNDYTKVVFFIDDLDRIEPSMAVEVLEALKNIFDVKNCIFILAIDYDVVVKGLEKKFGKMTNENEREFRSFFDKIIQVPFSMPLGAYNIDKLLQASFKDLGFDIGGVYGNQCKEIVSLTVGPNPRSIKRYINTYSLLKRIGDMEAENKEKEREEKEKFALFCLVGFQIAFPRIYSLIVDDPNYVEWNDEFARSNNISIEIPESYKNNELLDEYWEQFTWSYCQRDSHLMSNSLPIITALNLLRKVIKDQDLESILNEALQIANITSVEESKDAHGKKFKRERLETWEEYYKRQKSKGRDKTSLSIMKKLNEKVIKKFEGTEIVINYTGTGAITFNIPRKKRKKVFLYNYLIKNGVTSTSSLHDEKVVLRDTSQIDDAFLENAHKSYRLLMK